LKESFITSENPKLNQASVSQVTIFTVSEFSVVVFKNILPTNKFVVGALNHFYFGLIKCETALDKFKELYSIDE
jgi:hypothetical protein